MEWGEIMLRLGVATAAGMAIGIDRELRHRAAGLKTHMLVSLAAASVTLLAMQLDTNASRVVQGVVTGIGFIGGGAILHAGRHVEGVTTAATIWVCTMIGVAAGAGYYKIMAATLLFALLALTLGLAIEQVVRRAEDLGRAAGKPAVEVLDWFFSL